MREEQSRAEVELFAHLQPFLRSEIFFFFFFEFCVAALQVIHVDARMKKPILKGGNSSMLRSIVGKLQCVAPRRLSSSSIKADY